MKISIIISFALFIAFCAGSSSAQLMPNNLVHYSQMDGTIIYDILADQQGKIWMATQNGLVSFDGHDFQRFFPRENDTASIRNILTYSLLEDKNGRIWIGGMDGIDVFDPYKRSFRYLNISRLSDFPRESQPLVNTIISDKQGRIFFGINSGHNLEGTGALLFYDPDKDRLNRFTEESNQEIKNVLKSHADKDGNLWFYCINGLIKIDKDQHLEHYQYIEDLAPDEMALRNFTDSEWEDLIWIAGNSPLIYCFSPARKTFYSFSLQFLFDNKTTRLTNYTMTRDENNNLWIGSDHGLIFYNFKADKFETFSDDLNRNYGKVPVRSLNFDSFGNLWIGTDSEGLLKYNDRTAFTSLIGSLDESSTLKTGWISNIEESNDGDIWFVSTGDGENAWQIYELNPVNMALRRFDYRSITTRFSNIYTFIELSPGKFLIWTDRGLFDYSPHEAKIERHDISGFSGVNSVTDFFRDQSGNLWILSFDGLYLVNNNVVTKYYDLQEVTGSSSSSNAVYFMLEQERDIFWLVTNDGLFHFNHITDEIERVGYNKSSGDVFLSQDINSLNAGKDSILWVGTWMGGLSRYNMITGEIRTYTTDDGLPSMSIQGVLSAENDEVLWLSTFEGLSRFDVRDERFDNFSMEDGLHGSLFAEYTSLKTSKGLCIFGGNNGITFFYPEEIEKKTIPPKVFITDFKVADKLLSVRSNNIEQGDSLGTLALNLKYYHNNISIRYSGIHYANPSRNKFAYKLENYDDQWRDVGNQRTAYYYNLPAGDYTFKVKAANSNGVWNENVAFIRFTIMPPWWRAWWAYTIYGFLFLLLIFFLDRVQRKRVVNRERLLAREKELVHAKEIEKAYRELQNTQVQLIHAEKMASLGELTAGIAHEIQNPLNFVNNFSEVSIELLNELEKGITHQQSHLVHELSSDLRENLGKINAHGKRASSIVKGMLEHSRAGSGQKELININNLAAEYLHLAYHGARARNKSFNARFIEDFDESLPLINVVPQEIGRVILNLINNAFYAVDNKYLKRENGYIPIVTVMTRKVNEKIEIRIIDNGDGIPAAIRDKIFQPFFTTKPAGAGTGLGLSMSYDIITKGHRGELKMETIEGEGTEFVIILPI